MTSLQTLLATIVCIALGLPGELRAEERRPYLSFAGLYVIAQDSDFSGLLGLGEDAGQLDPARVETEITFDHGFGAMVAVGLADDDGFRGEVELGYRKSNMDRFENPSLHWRGIDFDVSDLVVDGDLETWSLMFNGFYTFDSGRAKPYVGAGIGLARHRAAIEKQNIGGYFNETLYVVSVNEASERDTVFAYQLMTGLAFPMGERNELRLGYRYFATGDTEHRGNTATYSMHGLEAGIVVLF